MVSEEHEITPIGLINEVYCQRTVLCNGKEFEVLVNGVGKVITDPTEVVRLCNNGQSLSFYSETGKVPEWYKFRGEGS